MKTPHVLVAHPYPDLYGADRVMLDAALAFREAGMRLTMVLPEPGPMTSWLDEHDVPWKCVPIPVLRRALLRPAALLGLARHSPRQIALAARTIRELGADVVYANTITLPHWILAARRARVPVVVHAHESDARIRRPVAAALAAPLLAADRVVAVSEAAATFLGDTLPRLRGRTVVVYNGLPVPEDVFAQPLDGPPARLAVIGRLGPNKAQDLAIAAVDSLVRAGRDVRLELAGDAFAGYESFERGLRESVRERGLAGRVTFAGFCNDVWGLLARTDIVLAPSRTDSLPLVVIEAMLARRPVVAARVGGIPELIDDGATGLLAPPEDVPALAGRVEALLDDPGLARRLGDAARVAAADRFGRERFRREIVAVVRDALSRHAKTP